MLQALVKSPAPSPQKASSAPQAVDAQSFLDSPPSKQATAPTPPSAVGLPTPRAEMPKTPNVLMTHETAAIH